MAAALLLAADTPRNGTREAGPKARLAFDVRTTQLAEVVARAQARLDAFGTTEARATQEGSRLVVELPASLASKRGEIEALLTRPHVLAFTIVENNSPLMIDLYGRLEQDPRSHTLGIFREIGSWQHADATHAIESDPFLEGQREALERYLAYLEVGHRADAYHDFSLSPVPERPKVWRTEYVDLRTRLRITRVLEATVEKSNLPGDISIELAFRLLPGDGERLRALTRGHLGKKMVISVDGEVLSTPVIEGAIGDRGRMPMSDEPLARRLAAALLGGPLSGELTATTPRADPVVGLGNLNIVGLGGPSPHCESIPESPSVSVSVSSSAANPAVREICDAIRALGPKIEACRRDTLRSLPFTEHALNLHLSVGKHRKAEHVTVSEENPSRFPSALGPCLARAMRKLKFARSMESEGEIHLLIHFAPTGSQ